MADKKEIAELTEKPASGEALRRSPTWDEMTDAQRFVALRDAVVWMARDLQAANEQLAKLGRHQHAADGQLVAPLHIGLGLMNEGGYSPQYAHNLRSKRDRG